MNVTEEKIIELGYSIDMVGMFQGQQVAVEFDGPHHFLKGKGAQSPSGSTILKHRQLRALGWRLVVVPYWEWETMTNQAERSDYLLRLLAAIDGQVVKERRQQQSQERECREHQDVDGLGKRKWSDALGPPDVEGSQVPSTFDKKRRFSSVDAISEDDICKSHEDSKSVELFTEVRSLLDAELRTLQTPEAIKDKGAVPQSAERIRKRCLPVLGRQTVFETMAEAFNAMDHSPTLTVCRKMLMYTSHEIFKWAASSKPHCWEAILTDGSEHFLMSVGKTIQAFDPKEKKAYWQLWQLWKESSQLSDIVLTGIWEKWKLSDLK
eukprot:gnl/MRDRNA2_/MRDRNA2_72642_c2_seq2.p1 gnl/MRDRNA2_/MRDRNA2_72642_c2~~gnl/MRDRNA2_/MRDRNA2_72642_c2_seq2.p1  ORF type:complete len:322 (+),score=59.07 gnl/MRDRNA2_/MRDRNA2_72642_c2_seq2:379-1344(+)